MITAGLSLTAMILLGPYMGLYGKERGTVGKQARSHHPNAQRDPTINASPNDWLHLPAAAKYVNKPERFMRRLVMERRIRFYKHGRYLAFRRSDLDAWATSDCREPWQ